LIPLAIEIPVKRINRAAFISQIIAWLRGSAYSKIFDNPTNADRDGEYAFISSSIGEELRIRELARTGVTEALGFRYDFPDGLGRTWRTEAVIRYSEDTNKPDLLRLRALCITTAVGAKVETPKKLFIIKNLIQDDLVSDDGIFAVIVPSLMITLTLGVRPFSWQGRS